VVIVYANFDFSKCFFLFVSYEPTSQGKVRKKLTDKLTNLVRTSFEDVHAYP